MASSPPRTRRKRSRDSTRAPRRFAWRWRWQRCGQSCGESLSKTDLKTARRQSREMALQALYAWQLSGGDPMEQARALEDFGKNSEFTESIVRGVRDRAAELQGLITPHLDRPLASLS